MKLTKIQTKAHNEAMRLIDDNKKLTTQEVEFCYENFHPGATHNQTGPDAFFTPFEFAKTFAVFCGDANLAVDVCAGTGMLARHVMWHHEIKKMRCIEFNTEYVRIGKRLLPEAEWICGDALNTKLWGKNISYIISNPPFSRVTGFGPFHMVVARESLEKSSMGAVMIMPERDHNQENVPFEARQLSNNYLEFKERTKHIPNARIVPCSADTCSEFFGAKTECAIVNVTMDQ